MRGVCSLMAFVDLIKEVECLTKPNTNIALCCTEHRYAAIYSLPKATHFQRGGDGMFSTHVRSLRWLRSDASMPFFTYIDSRSTCMHRSWLVVFFFRFGLCSGSTLCFTRSRRTGPVVLGRAPAGSKRVGRLTNIARQGKKIENQRERDQRRFTYLLSRFATWYM